MSSVQLECLGEITFFGGKKRLKEALHLHLDTNKATYIFTLKIQGQQDESCLMERLEKEMAAAFLHQQML